MTPEQKNTIDNMTQEELCRKWRFCKMSHPLFQGDTGQYFREALRKKGGFTPAISRRIGW